MRLFQRLARLWKRGQPPIPDHPTPAPRIPSYAFLTQSLQYSLGNNGSFERHRRNQETIYNRFNAFVEKSYDDVLIHIYLIKSSIPQLFSLVDVSPPCVAIDTRYIARLDVLMTRRPYLETRTNTLDIYTRLLLEITCDMAILFGDSKMAFDIYLTAAADGISHAYGEHFLDMQDTPVDENYLIKWCFCVAHEVGHIFAAQKIQPWTKGFNFTEVEIGHALMEAVEDPITLMIGADRSFQIDPETIDLFDLSEEIQADIVGIEILCRFAFETLQWDASNFHRIHWFCRELLWAFHFVYGLTCCRIIARGAIEAEDISTTRNDCKKFAICFLVRVKYIERFLGRALGCNAFSWIKSGELQNTVDPAIAEISMNVSHAFWSSIAPRLEQCRINVFAARDSSASPTDVDSWVAHGFRRKCEGFGSAYFLK